MNRGNEKVTPQKGTVVLVDKKPNENIKASLEQGGYLVEHVNWGSQLAAKMKEGNFDVLLSPKVKKGEYNVGLKEEADSCLFVTERWKRVIEQMYERNIAPLFYDFGYFSHYNSIVVDCYRGDGKSRIADEFPLLPEIVNWDTAPTKIQDYRRFFLNKLNSVVAPYPETGEGYVVIWLQGSTTLLKKEFQCKTVEMWARKIVELLKTKGLRAVIKCSPVGPCPQIEDVPVFADKKKAKRQNPNVIFKQDGLLNQTLIKYAKYHIVSHSSVTNELVLANAPVIAMGRSWFNGLDVFEEVSRWEDVTKEPIVNAGNRNKWINWWLNHQGEEEDISFLVDKELDKFRNRR